jgi:CMP-N-acetylneuraminic acid synthetase
MLKGKRFLAVVPARGGSKGLKRKNVRPLRGKPLLWYSVKQALAVKAIDAVVVSSDDRRILAAGKKAGAKTVLRPARLASDRARTEDALLHAIDELAKQGRRFDYVITLEPTHPLRRPETLRAAMETLVRGRFDSLMTLTPDSTDFWRKSGKTYARLFPNAPRRRQEREPLYKENSLIYITAVDVLKKYKFVLGKRRGFLITEETESLDIHTARDLKLAEQFL